jgi:hypothetical protein
MKERVAWLIGCFAAASLSLVAQEPAKPASEYQAAKDEAMSSDAKIRLAMTAGPTDLTKNAAVVEPGPDGKMMQLRAGTNGWVCIFMGSPPATMADPDVMCLDKESQGWVDAWMNKKDPQIKSVGIAYLLKGDKGASNTDPFAMAPTATNQWVVSPAHLMVLTPDANQLEALPTDPHNGGPWVMWKGTKYAHIMVPTVPMPPKAPAPK